MGVGRFRLLRGLFGSHCVVAAILAMVPGGAARAGEVTVAVAANFANAANEIGALFTEKTGHTAIFSFGSTGQLYSQISQGAPFEVFLSADRTRPAKALADDEDPDDGAWTVTVCTTVSAVSVIGSDGKAVDTAGAASAGTGSVGVTVAGTRCTTTWTCT